MAKRGKGLDKFHSSAILNNATYLQWLNYLTELAICRFKWENLPASIDPRFLELTLFSQGHALWFKDPVLGVDLCLTATLQGEYDVYNNPIVRTAFAANGYNYQCDNMNSVIIYNNYMRTGQIATVELYALRLTELDRTIDVNVKAQKTPVLITGSENQRLTLKNVYLEYDGNQPVIMGNKDGGIDQVGCIKTDAPLVSPQLFDLKNRTINEYLTRLGVENSNQDKKERLVANEVGSNYGVVELSRRSGLLARQEACQKINDMFDLDISVNFNSEVATLVNAPFIPETYLQPQEGGGE